MIISFFVVIISLSYYLINRSIPLRLLSLQVIISFLSILSYCITFGYPGTGTPANPYPRYPVPLMSPDTGTRNPLKPRNIRRISNPGFFGGIFRLFLRIFLGATISKSVCRYKNPHPETKPGDSYPGMSIREELT